MPKTTKKPKKSLVDRVNFRSRKTQFFLTALIFAVVGGGWLVYKSFAATQNAFTYVVHNGGLTNAVIAKGCKTAKPYDSAWKFNVVSLYCPKTGSFVGGSGADAVMKTAYLVDNREWRACAWVKGKATQVEVRLAIYSRGSSVGEVDPAAFKLNNTNSYEYHCTGSRRLAGYDLYGRTVLPEGYGGFVNVAAMVLEPVGYASKPF